MTKTDIVLDALHTEEKESALTFPCAFPIKVMGRRRTASRRRWPTSW